MKALIITSVSNQLYLLTVILHLVHTLRDAPKKGPITTLQLNTRHFIVRRRMTHDRASAYCERKKARLAVLCTLEDAKKLVEAIIEKSKPWTNDEDAAQRKYEFGMSRRYWIGLDDMGNEGQFLWERDGTMLLYTGMWLHGQPDHVIGPPKTKNEHCVTLWLICRNPNYDKGESHSFNDEPCLNKHYAICEPVPPSQNAGRSFKGRFKMNDETDGGLPLGIALLGEHDDPIVSMESDSNEGLDSEIEFTQPPIIWEEDRLGEQNDNEQVSEDNLEVNPNVKNTTDSEMSNDSSSKRKKREGNFTNDLETQGENASENRTFSVSALKGEGRILWDNTENKSDGS